MEKNDYDDWAVKFYKVKGWPKGGLKPEKAKDALRNRKKGDSNVEKQIDELAKGSVQKRLGSLAQGLVDLSPAKIAGDKRYKKMMQEVQEATKYARSLIDKGMVIDVKTRGELNVGVRKLLNDALLHYSSRQNEKVSGRRGKKIQALKGCLENLDNLLALDLKRNEEEKQARLAFQKQLILQPGGLGDQVCCVCREMKHVSPQEGIENAKLLKNTLADSDPVAREVLLSVIATTLTEPTDSKSKSKENNIDDVLASLVKGLEDSEPINDLYTQLINLEGVTQNQGNFFRGSEVCMKLAAQVKQLPENQQFLDKVSGEVVNDLIKTNERWELDPNKRKEQEPHTVEDTLNHYKDVVRKTLILLDPAKVPLDLCRSCYEIYRMYMEKFNNEDGALNVASGHLFIRFISPAFSADLLKLKPTKEGMSQGVRIAKILQNIGNGVRFGSKEQFMIPFNEIIDEYEDARIDLARQVVAKGKPK